MESLINALVNRRDALRVSSAGLGLSFLLPGVDLRAAERRGKERPKSLIVLWMAGGPSQLETWDPKPGTKIGGPTRSIKTTLPGLEIADLLPRMAEQIHHLSVIRSLVSKEGDHERGSYYLMTGYRPDPTVTHPSLGAIAAHQLPDKAVEIPQHIALATGDGFTAPRGGFLGNEFDAFRVFDPGRSVQNMRASVGDKRQQRRLEGLNVVSQAFRSGRERRVEKTLHQHVIEQALTMMSSEQLAAFEIEDEPATTVKAYGDSRFGRGCLVARRLVESGVRAVQVTLNGFDTHANNFEGHQEQAAMLDPAFAALTADLVERDLLDSTIVLCIGEFGRTPRVNPLEGRDHWPNGFSCVIGGGGLQRGVVIGETRSDFPGNDVNRQGTNSQWDPVDPIAVPDLFATILHTLSIDHTEEIITPIGRPIALSEGTPIERLL